MKRPNFLRRSLATLLLAGIATMIPGSAIAQTGVLQWSAWNNLPGVAVEDLTQAPKFLNAPDVNFTVAGSGSPIDSNDSFGGRLRGTITAPVTGNYTFWIASDDSSELWLGTSESRFSKQLIASVNGWTPVQSWNVYGSQQSVSVALQAGQKYWIEALVKEGGGGDHVEIAWEYPGQSRQMIPTTYLEWPGADAADANDDGLPDTWADTYQVSGAYNDPDHDGALNIEEYQASTNPLQPSVTGVLEWNVWFGIGGSAVSDLTGNSKFLQKPDETAFVNSAASPVDYADSFGSRLRGMITAPVTGTYQFWTASDDNSELWLGTAASRFTKRKIAQVNGWTGVAQWDNNPSQQSIGIELQAGQQYWIEALAKDGGGGDHVEIAWQYPGQSRQIIPSAYLNPGGVDILDINDDGIPDAWATTHGVTGGAFADTDGDGNSNLEEYQNGTHPNQQGSLEWSVWFNITGENLSALINSPKFLLPPDQVSKIHGSAAPNDYGTSFGQRLRGTITAPVTGNYTFWMSSDNQGQLWLGTNASRFTKQKIAYVDGWTGFQQWDANPSQQSVSIALQAGQKYWIEALAKEGDGGDNLAIAWEYPGQSRQLIPKLHLLPPEPESNDTDDDGLPDSWQTQYGIQNAYGDDDLDGVINITEYQSGTSPVGGVPGYLSRDVWYGIAGETVKSLTHSGKFLQEPDLTELWAGAAQPLNSAGNAMDNFGQRLRGTITAPTSGAYTFWLAADENAALWLSTDDSKFNKVKIAAVEKYTGAATGSSSVTINNPGGEEPNKGSGGWNYHSGNEHGWQFNGGGIAQNGSPWFGPAAPEGLQALFMQAGSLSQVINIPSSGIYSVTFKAAGRGGEYGPAGVKVEVDGNTYLSVDASQISQSEWRTFTATGISLSAGTHALTFAHHNTLGGDKSVAIDEVQMTGTGSYLAQVNNIAGGAVGFGQFDVYPLQRSNQITLQAGQQYFIEVLHKESTGTEHVAVAWHKPGASREIIPTQYLASYSKELDDLDDDDLPDSWEEEHSLSPADNGLFNTDNAKLGDPDHDNLTNHSEWLLGTDPKDADTDNDGALDGNEAGFYDTNPLVADTEFQTIATTLGNEGTVVAGSWDIDSTTGTISIGGNSIRGSLDYAFNLPSNGIYALKINFGNSDAYTSGNYKLYISVDNVSVGWMEKRLYPGQTATEMLILPWLQQGQRNIRISYENANFSQSLSIFSLVLEKAEGSDSNNNGIADWLDALIEDKNTIETTSTFSLTSPACIEGKGRYEWLQLQSEETVHPAPNNSWYVDVDLAENGAFTTKSFIFENGAVQANLALQWTACNILSQSDLTIRKGDALRLTGHTGVNADNSSVALYLDNQLLSTTTANQPYVHRFNQAGIFQVKAVYQPASEAPTEQTITVTVKEASFNGSPVVVVNQYRNWENPNIPASVEVEFDEQVPVTAIPLSSGIKYRITVPDLTTRYVVARLGANGPILGHTTIRPQQVFSAEDTQLQTVEVLPDGTRLIKMKIVASRLYEDSPIRLLIFVGGLVFQDTGDVIKILSPSDFDSTGVATVFFLKSANSATSVCHSMTIYEGAVHNDISIGTRDLN